MKRMADYHTGPNSWFTKAVGSDSALVADTATQTAGCISKFWTLSSPCGILLWDKRAFPMGRYVRTHASPVGQAIPDTTHRPFLILPTGHFWYYPQAIPDTAHKPFLVLPTWAPTHVHKHSGTVAQQNRQTAFPMPTGHVPTDNIPSIPNFEQLLDDNKTPCHWSHFH